MHPNKKKPRFAALHARIMPVVLRQRAFERQCPVLPKCEEKERPPAVWGMPNSRSKKVSRKEPAEVHDAKLGKRSRMQYTAS